MNPPKTQRQPRGRHGYTPRKFSYEGEQLTIREIAERVDADPDAVRAYYRYHKSFEGIEKKKDYSRSSGEGMSLDTLYLNGRIDDDTYIRYLRDFGDQQRHGRGHKAVARIVDGKMYYEMSDKEDYFYGGMNFDDWCLYHPIEEVFQAAADRLPLPDYRHMVMREIEKSNDMRWIPYWGWESVVGERWLATGSMTMPPDDFALDESLDDYLKRVEDSPEDSL